MTRRARTLALTIVLATAGCYAPDYTGRFACEAATAARDCPDGWTCVEGRCADPTKPPPPPCASGGSAVWSGDQGSVWACNGSFTAGQLDALCNAGAGYHVCGGAAADSGLLGQVECGRLTAFYAVRVDVAVQVGEGGYRATCSPGAGDRPRALLGCGAEAGVVKLKDGGCRSLDQAIVCPGGGAWSCGADAGAASAGHAAPTGGALCCRAAP